jgi:hypothetical protein
MLILARGVMGVAGSAVMQASMSLVVGASNMIGESGAMASDLSSSHHSW